MQNSFPPVVEPPKGRPRPEGEELAVIVQRLGSERAVAKLSELTDCELGEYLIWRMPFHHTAYASDLNEYMQFLRSPHIQTYYLSRLTEKLLLRDMYDTCRIIVRERKNVRLRELKKAA